MSDAGYTVLETLAALAIIAMMVGSLTMGAQVLGRAAVRNETAVRDERTLRQAETNLQELLSHQGPFRSDDARQFTGTSDGFTYVCAGELHCGANLEKGAGEFTLKLRDQSGRTQHFVARGSGQPHFRYLSDRAEGDQWTPDSPLPQSLRAVILTVDDASPPTPPMVARVWVEQPARCVFDAITQDCR